MPDTAITASVCGVGNARRGRLKLGAHLMLWSLAYPVPRVSVNSRSHITPSCDSRRTFALCCDILARKQAHNAECDAAAANRSPLPHFIRRYFLEASAGQRTHAGSALAAFSASVVTAAAKTKAEDVKGRMSPARVVYWFGVLAKLVDQHRYCAPLSDFLCDILGAQVTSTSGDLTSSVATHEQKSDGMQAPPSSSATTVFAVLVREGMIGLHTACQVGRRCLVEWVGRERWMTVERELRARVSPEGILRGSAVGVCEWVDAMLSAWEREYRRRIDVFKNELDIPSKPALISRSRSTSKVSQIGADRKLWRNLAKVVAPDLPLQALERYSGDCHRQMHDARLALEAVENLAALVPWCVCVCACLCVWFSYWLRYGSQCLHQAIASRCRFQDSEARAWVCRCRHVASLPATLTHADLFVLLELRPSPGSPRRR